MESLAAGGRELRFGVLCDGTDLQQWQLECLEALRGVPRCEPVVIVVNATSRPAASTVSPLRRMLRTRKLCWTIFDRLVASRASTATKRVGLPPWLSALPRIPVTVRREGPYSEHFSESDIERLRSLDLDFLLKFGFGIIRGEILEAAKHGVWSFHHDDESRYRGAPPCFWEIFQGDPVTGAVLQRLTSRLDGGVILRRGYFGTISHSYVANRDQVYLGSAVWPAQVCRDLLSHGDASLPTVPTTSQAPIYRYPGNATMLRFVLVLGRNWFMRQLRDLVLCDIWAVGLIDDTVQNISRQGTTRQVRWLTLGGRGRYVADPCGISVDGVDWIFAEAFSYLQPRGYIAAAQIDAESISAEWITALKTSVHMSYPQVFEHEGRYYSVAEAAEGGNITLFASDTLPCGWEQAAVLVDNFKGVDPSLWFHNGRWWLFCTDGSCGDCSHLHIYYADTLAGPYREHANNPVKIDIRSSRPAGVPFQLDGNWVRPAQNDAQTYGAAITLNKLLKLSPDEFEEEICGEITPAPNGAFPDGLHTIRSFGAHRTLIDGKRRSFVPEVFAQRLARKARRLVSALTVSRVQSS